MGEQRFGTHETVAGANRFFNKVVLLPSGTFRVDFATATTPSDLADRDYDAVGNQLTLVGTTEPFGGARWELQDIDHVLTLGGSRSSSNAAFSESAL